MPGNLSQFFTGTDYLMSLPIILLTLFALGILLIDLMVPAEWKGVNAITALVGILFSAAGVWKIQAALGTRPGQPAMMNAMVVDHFAIYFWYLFLASAAISILMSMHYLEVEREHHGEFYSLILFSIVGMMCMSAGFDIVLIFIGLELMAISTYVLVGFLRTDRRSNEKIVALNQWMKDYAAKHNIVYLDYFTVMLDDKSVLKKELTYDGLHPNDAGYELMLPLAEKAVAAVLASPR